MEAATQTRPSWMEDDELFAELLALGHEHTLIVGKALADAGFTVDVPQSVLRKTVKDRHAFQQEIDLLVGKPCDDPTHSHAEPMPMAIEVKSRDQRFTSGRTFPFRTAIVDTVSGWDRKAPKPGAVICISQHTKAMFVIRRWTARRWTKEWRLDRKRRIHDWFYECPRGDLQEFDPFLADLRTWLGPCRL